MHTCTVEPGTRQASVNFGEQKICWTMREQHEAHPSHQTKLSKTDKLTLSQGPALWNIGLKKERLYDCMISRGVTDSFPVEGVSNKQRVLLNSIRLYWMHYCRYKIWNYIWLYFYTKKM